MTRRLALAAVALAGAAIVALCATGTAGIYGTPGSTLNGGVYAGPCVVELWGQPGIGRPGNG